MSISTSPRAVSTIASQLVWVFLAGCGGPYDASVEGMVTLDGSPLPRGTVAFAPKAPGPLAYGRIEDDGKYMLRTGREEGLPSGEYQVTVVATEASAEYGKGGGPPPMGKLISPAWYSDSATSGLNNTVESGHNEINLELTTAPPPGWKSRTAQRN